GCLVARSAQAACQPAGGVRSAQKRANEGRQPERSGGCPQLGRATAHQPSQAGVSRKPWNPCLEGVGAELLDAHPGQYPGDESHPAQGIAQLRYTDLTPAHLRGGTASISNASDFLKLFMPSSKPL